MPQRRKAAVPAEAEAEAVAPHLDEVASLFHQAQTSRATLGRCVRDMHALRASTADKEAFDEEFFNCVQCVLPVAKLEPAVERVIDFVVSFTTLQSRESSIDEEFVQSLCLSLLGLVDSMDKGVRWRVAQLVGRMYESLPEDAEVSDELFEMVESTMRTRCHDKVAHVRKWAIKALYRFQNPADPDDVVVAELIRLMCEDNAKEVRMAAVETIVPCQASIRAILERVRDVEPDVRMHALEVLTEKFEMRWLSISQRVQLLECALNDRKPAVVDKCAEMIVCWLHKACGVDAKGKRLHKACGDDVLELMRKLDSVTNERVVLLVLRTLLTHKKLPVLSRPAVQLVVAAASKWWASSGEVPRPREPPTPQAALCLRAYLETCAEFNAATCSDVRLDALVELVRLDELEPELADLCAALQLTASKCAAPAADDGTPPPSVIQNTSALCHLAHAAAKCDMTNEAGRESLGLVCRELLCELTTPDEALSPLFAALKAADPAATDDVASFQVSIMELISDVQEPMIGDEGCDASQSQLQCQMHELRLCDLREKLYQEEDGEERERLAQEARAVVAQIESLQSASGGASPEVEFQRSVRALRLMALMLQMTTVELAEFQIDDLECRAATALESPRWAVRELAVTCYGLLGQSSKERATKLLPHLTTAVQIAEPAVRLAALRASFDLMLIHSPATVLHMPTLRREGRETDGEDGDKVEEGNEEGGVSAEARAKALKAQAAIREAVAAGAPAAPIEDEVAYAIGNLAVPLLSERSVALRHTAALGLCKLMHTNALRSSSLLARLLLVHFEAIESAKASADAATRLQLAELTGSLKIFFAAADCKVLSTALLPALRLSLHAETGDDNSDTDGDGDDNDAYVPERSSRERKAHLESLCAFILDLTRPGGGVPVSGDVDGCSEAYTAHLELSVALCCETYLFRHDGEAIKPLCKALGWLLPPGSTAGLPPDTAAEALKSLTTLSGLLVRLTTKVVLDKASLKSVNSLAERVQLLKVSSAGEGEDGSMRAEEKEQVEAHDAAALASATLSAHKRLREAMAARLAASATMAKQLKEAPSGRRAANTAHGKPTRRKDENAAPNA